jgi:tetratricopeptide (TPR) repeat protein
MPAFGMKALLPLAMTAALGSAAVAQGKQCEINEGSPGEIARAMLALQVAQSSNSPDAVGKQLKNAIAQLEKADAKKNPVGRNFVLGKTLVMWMAQPDMPVVTTRGTLGFTGNAQAPIDIVSAIDSAFSEVEKAQPECESQTTAWRQQKGWVTLVNAAIELANAEKLDSAEVLAKRSLVLFRGAPYGHMVLGNIAQKRGQTVEALKFFRETVNAAQDTTFSEVRRSMLLNIGNIATQAAEGATGADKASFTATAKLAFEELAKDATAGAQFADAAQQGLARLAQASGDTAAVKATYQDKLANPSAFTYQQLMSAAVTAANANQTADATKLFEAAYKENPYHRDVLANLAIMYIQAEQHGKALEYVKRLVEVDPSNGENYRLFTHVYAGTQKRLMAANREYGRKANATTNARLKKAYIDSATITNDSIKVVTDLALKYNMMADSLPVKVTFSEFSTTDDQASIGGSIMNNSDASKSYTMKVEFLDKAGKVIAAQEANVGPVAGKSSGRFSVKAAGKGIAAFRYAPLP